MFSAIFYCSVTVNVLQKTTKELLIENQTPELVMDVIERKYLLYPMIRS
jgi:hypothetical protein